MYSEPITVDILSERESPVGPVTIKEEVAYVDRIIVSAEEEEGGKHPSSPAQKKRHTRSSVQAQEEEAVQAGPLS